MANPQDFIAQYTPVAQAAASKLGVDPAILLGQWGLETGWGRSVIPGTNNLGNIKDFSGGGVGARDNMTGSQDKYRAYDTPDAFANDYSGLIGRRYQGAIGAGSDAVKYASALKAGGYAEDPDYVRKLTAATDTVRGLSGVRGALNRAAEVVFPAAQAAQPGGLDAAGILWDDAPTKGSNFDQSSIQWDKEPTLGDTVVSGIEALGRGTRNLGRGVYQGLTDIMAGEGQNATNETAKILNDLAPGSALDRRAQALALDANQQATTREEDYQAATPGSFAAGAGRVLGNIATSAGEGAAFNTAAELGSRAIPAVGRLIGGTAVGAVLGAAQQSIAPVVGAQTPEQYSAQQGSNMQTGAVLGGAIPLVAGSIGAVRTAARTAGSLVEPFSQAGQGRIADRVVRNFAGEEPLALNTKQFVPGATPTLAQATDNAGIAGLERGLRNDPRFSPQFSELDQANSLARNQALNNVVGDTAALDAARAARSSTASTLYDRAAQNFNGSVPEELQPAVKELLQRPSIQRAIPRARDFAAERGQQPASEGSLQGLHDIKTALDDQIASAIRNGEGGHATSLGNTKDALLGVMERLSPEYRTARETYAAMSQPVNAMETLQKLNLVDSQGNITLNKIQNGIRSLQRQMREPGANAAKSVTADQVQVLTGIRDDLLRAANTGRGRAVGSPTTQNFAIENILQNALPGRVGVVLGRTAGGGVVNRLGQLIYGGTDEPIRQEIVNRLLDASRGIRSINPGDNQIGGAQNLINTLAPYAVPAAGFGAIQSSGR